MAATPTKDIHIRAILEFYKAGYITRLEKDKLIAYLYKANYVEGTQLEISINVEGRELHYRHWIGAPLINVKGDFHITYDAKRQIFIEGEG